MSDFDIKAGGWDNEKQHIDRSEAIAAAMEKEIRFRPGMKALEYGAGTGLLSFLLKDKFDRIVLMDKSGEMIRICKDKIRLKATPHIQAVLCDLEVQHYPETFDIIFSQMVLHHVQNIDLLLDKFYTMLNPGGLLVVADLFSEDGSFHEKDEQVHPGFDPALLLEKAREKGFDKGRYTPCYVVRRSNNREYPVFLLWTVR